MDFHFNTGRAKEFSGDNSSKDGFFFLGYMKGGRGLWKRRVSEYLMFSEGEYINFEFIKSKKGKQGLVSTFEAPYYLDEFQNRKDEEHTRSDGKTPASTITTRNE